MLSSRILHRCSNKDIKWAIGGWCFFVAENLVLSENRTYLIDQFGDERYHMVYGTFSTIASASIGYSYVRLRRHYKNTVKQAMKLTPKHPSMIMASWLVLTVGMNMIAQTAPKFQIPFEFASPSSPSLSLQQQQQNEIQKVDNNIGSVSSNKKPKSSWQMQVRCPFDFTDKRQSDSSKEDSSIYGLERVTRHPGLWSFSFLSLGHAMLIPSATPFAILPLQLWWAGPSLIALLGGAHTDSRYRRNMGGSLHPKYDRQTSNIPFAAMFTGRQGNVFTSMRELLSDCDKPLNAMLATTISTVYVMSYVSRTKRLPPSVILPR